MSEDYPDLKLVSTPEPLKGSNCFWNVCPRLLEFLPESACPEAKPELDKMGRVPEEPHCPWWINDEASHYCFWKYLHSNSTPEGVMEELTLKQISDLFGWSSTRMTKYYKEAMEELEEVMYDHYLDEHIEDFDPEVDPLD